MLFVYSGFSANQATLYSNTFGADKVLPQFRLPEP